MARAEGAVEFHPRFGLLCYHVGSVELRLKLPVKSHRVYRQLYLVLWGRGMKSAGPSLFLGARTGRIGPQPQTKQKYMLLLNSWLRTPLRVSSTVALRGMCLQTFTSYGSPIDISQRRGPNRCGRGCFGRHSETISPCRWSLGRTVLGYERGSSSIKRETKWRWLTRHFPEFYAQLTDLRAVLHVVDEIAHSRPTTSRASTNAMTALRSLADRTSQTLLELQTFIDEKLENKSRLDKHANSFAWKRTWARNEPKLRMFRERLRDCRVGIALHLSIISTESV